MNSKQKTIADTMGIYKQNERRSILNRDPPREIKTYKYNITLTNYNKCTKTHTNQIDR